MKTNQPIRIDQPGTYLFADPTKVIFQLDSEILVTFHGNKSDSTAMTLYAPTSHLQDFLDDLTHLWGKYRNSQMGKSTVVEAKVFGLSHGPTVWLNALESWTKDNGIKLAASDTGRGIPRQAMVDCKTGMVGLSYAESIPLSAAQSLLNSGSARARQPLQGTHAKVLVLSQSQVFRKLAAQSVEEHPSWEAFAPTELREIFTKKTQEKWPWAVVLISSDLEPNEALLPWMKKVAKQAPQIQMRWVGGSLPLFASEIPSLRLLPPLDPILLPEFKQKLRTAVFDHGTSITSDVIPFPKKKGAR